MLVLKKLIFGPLFLITFAFLLIQLKSNLSSYDAIFSLSLTTLIELLILSALICVSSFLFVLFISFSSDWKLSLPIGIVASILPVILIKDAAGFVLCIGATISMLITYLALENKLKTYLNFEPSSIFGPSIKHLAVLLILVFSFTYFLSINKIIQIQGFQIPDSLIDTALKFSGQEQMGQQDAQTIQPQLSQDQINLLKQNPQALKQAGLDPKILDSLNQSSKKSSPSQNLIKEAVKTQLDNVIKPYLGIVPEILAVLFFFILQTLTSLINLLVYPLLWIIFYIFEKTKFITFTEEQRTVRKMIV